MWARGWDMVLAFGDISKAFVRMMRAVALKSPEA